MLIFKILRTSQSMGERNYHIFYQLICGSSQEEKKKYFLKDLKEYAFICDKNPDNLFNEAEEFALTKLNMREIGFSVNQQKKTFFFFFFFYLTKK